MLSYRVIPSLLLRRGRLVKGVNFAHWRDAGNPVTTASIYNAQKADELILLDIDAGTENRSPDLKTVAAVAFECQMPLTVGGNIRTADDARDCLRHGADKIYVNKTVLQSPDLITDLAKVFGSQAVVLGIDVLESDGTYRLRTPSSVKNREWLDWLKEGVDRGAGEVRLMNVSREGTRRGLSIDLWEMASREISVPIILEGGAGVLNHLVDAMRHEVNSIAIGTMLVFCDNNIVQVKSHLKNAGFPIRWGNSPLPANVIH